MGLRRSCRRFRKLRLSSPERGLRVGEQTFCAEHVHDCTGCRRYDSELSAAREALRSSSVNHHGPAEFANRVVRAISRDRIRRQFEVWRPTLIGAVTAAIAVGAVLQVLTPDPEYDARSPEGTAALPAPSETLIFDFDLPRTPELEPDSTDG
ncbi:MAG: hypothetical protein IH851_00360 [Armatimonadetes bacterium]|nr:hypothetical protein [Armatimonadota bacterium]